jgi:hypothetical protein
LVLKLRRRFLGVRERETEERKGYYSILEMKRSALGSQPKEGGALTGWKRTGEDVVVSCARDRHRR